MASLRPLVLVFNGEDLHSASRGPILSAKGHRFRSGGDTECWLQLLIR